MKKEYYLKHRPRQLSEVIGQDNALKSIKRLIDKGEFPQAILLTGPSGTGKTTLARILGKEIGCHPSSFHEMDCTQIEKPLDFVRDIKKHASLAPLHGKVSVWFLEEFQSLSRAGFSQQALLKLLEDGPTGAYFILATTDPQKVNKAILTRCSEIKLGSIKERDLEQILVNVQKAEKIEVSEAVINEIIACAEGSARKALVILQQVAGLKGEEEQLKAIESTTAVKDDVFQLARMIMGWKPPSWPEIAGILRTLQDSDVESIRHMILTCANKVMLGDKSKFYPRAFAVIDIFSRPFFDSKQAGLTAACYEVYLNSTKK